MKNNIWTLDGTNEAFDTLKDAKWHVEIAYTPAERMKYLRNSSICHVVNDEVVSTVSVKIDNNGNFKFGRVEKY